ncbi:dihydroorotase [Eubacteriales bacterium OttesenSCG-928-G02]|nr:dihydroorotase [Eubacteriales bacterium OttesenSCG-928-G02]
MKTLLRAEQIYKEKSFQALDILIDNNIIIDIAPIHSYSHFQYDKLLNFTNCYIFPGFADVHVHLREPGFSYKETIKTGSIAAAHGGFTSICTMPNLNPPPDNESNIKTQLEIIKKDSAIDILPYGTITKNRAGLELAEFDRLKYYTNIFSDDGSGVQNDDIMLKAMQKVKSFNGIIAAHCEVNELLDGGYIHKGKYSKTNNHKGICSESEWKQIERDIKLVEKTNCNYHVCHISTKESVELIRRAKKQGLPVTCETAPHYLMFCEDDLREEGRFKMNPPLRSKQDKEALLEGIADRTIDCIATDHAPHSYEEKNKGLKDSAMGVVGLETSFSAAYTALVKSGIINLEQLIELMSINPRKIFGLYDNKFEIGKKADLTAVDINEKYIVSSNDFLSMGKSTPFEGCELYGKVKMTFTNGKSVWENNK